MERTSSRWPLKAKAEVREAVEDVAVQVAERGDGRRVIRDRGVHAGDLPEVEQIAEEPHVGAIFVDLVGHLGGDGQREDLRALEVGNVEPRLQGRGLVEPEERLIPAALRPLHSTFPSNSVLWNRP